MNQIKKLYILLCCTSISTLYSDYTPHVNVDTKISNKIHDALEKIAHKNGGEFSENDLAYVKNFPFGSYTVFSNKNGSFFLDDINDCIKNVLRSGNCWEGTTTELLYRVIPRGTTAIDIGAHIGVHSVTMSRCVGATGTVLAFEPQLKLFRELVANLTINECSNVIPYHYALGADDNTKIFLAPPIAHNEGGRFISPENNTGESVTLKKLDSFKANNVSFIKIDVENYEYEVLRGAENTIKKHKPILLIEIQGSHNFHTKENAQEKKKQKIIGHLETLGYVVLPFHGDDYVAIYRK